MNIIILGVPGSGKGTQSKILEKKFNLKQLSTGEMLRNEVTSGSELGNRVRKRIHSGRLVSDEIIINIISKRLDEKKMSKGVIFDGFPRTVPQAEALTDLLVEKSLFIDYVFELIVDDDSIIERVIGRYSCKECGIGYHEKFEKPKLEGTCDKCGNHDFVRRNDDTEDTVRDRLKQYHHQTAPIIAYYSDAGLLTRVNGMTGINEVTDKFNEIIQ